MTQHRAHWGSRLGFIFAAAGSAIGLANIWRFPYITGQNGGGAFILIYLLALALIGFPVFVSEILMGRRTQNSPVGAFRTLGKSAGWTWVGKMTIFTGFIVSAFYSAIAGWILGYLVEALRGNLHSFTTPEQVSTHYSNLVTHPWWAIIFHFLFLALATGVVYKGVRGGIERSNKILMPLLFILLFILVIKGLSLEGAGKGLSFLLTPEWSKLTPLAFLIALGQSFFTLSLGQGTMITYGSYLQKNQNIVTSCLPIVLMDTLASILSSIIVFTIVFSAGMQPDSGPGLIFNTLPLVFSQIPAGQFVAVLFFLAVFLAALTSEVSVLEPVIAYLMDEHHWQRKKAVIASGIAAFIVGIPCALATSVLASYTFNGMNILEGVSHYTSAILIPLGGFFAVVLVGWFWGVNYALHELHQGADGLFERQPWLSTYFTFCFKYCAPVLVILVLMSSLGIFG